MSNKKEIERRRTFAIVSHPDAGKTTLTEKLLLFGGAIRVAGAVKSNKIKKTATSDFMEIERQRGISVATAVMGFEYEDFKINILDTPGHEDFAEDTYRTLTAVDSVIIVVDAAKGVEKQTRRLMEVCRMRNTPVIVFINKLDRPSKDAFELMDELEEELKIHVRPLSWPIGNGDRFQGVYNLYEKKLNLFQNSTKQKIGNIIEFHDLSDSSLNDYIGEDRAEVLREETDLINEVYPEFENNEYLSGNIAPVFFGSALNNFGVKDLLDCFAHIAPHPRGNTAKEREITPLENKFSGFVFKIHANMDPKHRDRLAFVKICSGKFERNKTYYHVGAGKNMKIANPTAFMASKKSTVDEAYPGDIIGIHDTGNLKIGDTITEGEKIHFKGIPNFSPELFKYLENSDPSKYKQLAKGIDQLMDEGVAQFFENKYNDRKIIGTVGSLQFDVIKFRLEHEYGASCRFEPIRLYKACWIESEDDKELEDFRKHKYQFIAEDKKGREVFLAESPYALQTAQKKYKNIKFHFSTDFEQ